MLCLHSLLQYFQESSSLEDVGELANRQRVCLGMLLPLLRFLQLGSVLPSLLPPCRSPCLHKHSQRLMDHLVSYTISASRLTVQKCCEDVCCLDFWLGYSSEVWGTDRVGGDEGRVGVQHGTREAAGQDGDGDEREPWPNLHQAE